MEFSKPATTAPAALPKPPTAPPREPTAPQFVRIVDDAPLSLVAPIPAPAPAELVAALPATPQPASAKPRQAPTRFEKFKDAWRTFGWQHKKHVVIAAILLIAAGAGLKVARVARSMLAARSSPEKIPIFIAKASPAPQSVTPAKPAVFIEPTQRPIRAAPASKPENIYARAQTAPLKVAPLLQDRALAIEDQRKLLHETMDACANEIGLFCNSVKDREWASVKCLRKHQTVLLLGCRSRLEDLRHSPQP